MSVERCVVRGRISGVDRERSRGDFVGEFEALSLAKFEVFVSVGQVMIVSDVV